MAFSCAFSLLPLPFPPGFVERKREGNQTAPSFSFIPDPSRGFYLYKRKKAHSYTTLKQAACIHTSFSRVQELSGWSYLFTAGLAICHLWKVKATFCHWGTSILLPQSHCSVLHITTQSGIQVCWKEWTPALWRVVSAFWIHRGHPIQLSSLLLSLLSPHSAFSQCWKSFCTGRTMLPPAQLLIISMIILCWGFSYISLSD